MKPRRILFTNGLLIDPGAGIFGQRDLLIVDGRVKAEAASLAPFVQWKQDGRDLFVYDLKGRHLFPGLVDIHVHLRVPGQEHKETIQSGTASAAAGGFTTVLAMPNTQPCIDNAATLRGLQKRLTSEAAVGVLPASAITLGQQGKELVDIEGLKQEGAVAFSDDGRSVMNARIMRAAMEETKRIGCPIISHCEDDDLARGGVIQEGKIAEKLGVNGIPHAAEEAMVARDICLASDTRAHLHLAHVSTEKSIAMVRIAKDKGLPVTAEVTPHHLTLTETAVLQLGTNAKVNPPLRTERDLTALQEGLKDGTVDAVASDHAPHHPSEKALSLPEAPFGLIGLESTLPVMLSLVHEGLLPLERVIELLTIGPAKALGLAAGTLMVGQAADLVVVDMESSYQVDAGAFSSKARNCPFDGWSLKGRALATIVGGKAVFEKDNFLQERVTVL